MRAAILAAALALASAPVFACALPEDDPGLPRLIVLRVKHLPEVEAWAEQRAREGLVVHYHLALDEPVRHNSLCWLPVEVRAGGKPWRRYLVTPDRGRVMQDDEISGVKAGNRR